MKIEIYKKDNDENIYYSYNEQNDLILNFENLKELSKYILDEKINNRTISCEVTCETNLILYKSTVEEIIKSVNEDTELFELYKQNVDDLNQSDDQDEKINSEENVTDEI